MLKKLGTGKIDREIMRRALFLFLTMSVFFTGCAHKVKLVDFETGQTIFGTYNTTNRSVSLTLPSGEYMRGQYSALTNTTISYSSLFYNSSSFSTAFANGITAFGQSHGSGTGNIFGINTGGSSQAYAILSGGRGTVMEMILQYNELNGRGFGLAKTNTGKEYKVIFPVDNEVSVGNPITDQSQYAASEQQLPPGRKNDALQWLEKSQKCVQEERWVEAIRTASIAISLEPGFAEPYINRAWAYNERGLYEKAIEDCEKALELDPGNGAARNNRGVSYFKTGKTDKAIEDYRLACQKGLEVSCKNFEEIVGYLPSEEINLLLATSLENFAMGNYDKVIEITSQVIDLEPDNAVAFANRCGANANKGLLKEAKADCSQAIKLNPDYALAYNNQAYILELEGDVKEAIIYYEMSCGLGNNLGCRNQKRLTAPTN